MTLSWQTETGLLSCQWSHLTANPQGNPEWMRQESPMQGGYLPPLPHYAEGSPFGGASWFEWTPTAPPGHAAG